MKLWCVGIEYRKAKHERKTRAWEYAVIAETEARALELAIERNTSGLPEYKNRISRTWVMDEGDPVEQVIEMGMRFKK